MHKAQLWLCFVMNPPLWLRKKLGTAKCRKQHFWQQEILHAAAKLSKTPVEGPGSPSKGEGADGLTLKRASKGNKHRNGRKKLGPKRENVLDPLGSLFAINKEKISD